jgi:hypothetical protein
MTYKGSGDDDEQDQPSLITMSKQAKSKVNKELVGVQEEQMEEIKIREKPKPVPVKKVSPPPKTAQVKKPAANLVKQAPK